MATVGTQPGDLATVCAAESLLPHLALDVPVDFVALRRVSDMGEPSQEELETVGTPCGGATDMAACEASLAMTWPSSTGWGYCGEGCSDSGLVWTRGDEVGLADAPEEVVAFFGTIDAPAEALLRLTAEGYLSVDCPTLTEREGGSYEVEAVWLVSDCEWTEETRRVRIEPDGSLTVSEVLDTFSDGSCAR